MLIEYNKIENISVTLDTVWIFMSVYYRDLFNYAFEAIVMIFYAYEHCTHGTRKLITQWLQKFRMELIPLFLVKTG